MKSVFFSHKRLSKYNIFKLFKSTCLNVKTKRRFCCKQFFKITICFLSLLFVTNPLVVLVTSVSLWFSRKPDQFQTNLPLLIRGHSKWNNFKTNSCTTKYISANETLTAFDGVALKTTTSFIFLNSYFFHFQFENNSWIENDDLAMMPTQRRNSFQRTQFLRQRKRK